MATTTRPPHTFSPSYVPRSRPASPALVPISSVPTASTSSASRPSSERPRSTPGSPLVNSHSAPKSSPLVHPPARSSPVAHALPMKPNSPALTPRLSDRSERRGSGLKHELRNGERSSKKAKEATEVLDEGANAILKILAGLPAPLPETLPSTFLPTPRTTPSPTQSFAEWAKSSKRRRSLSDDSTRSSSDSASSSRAVGLGLGLSISLNEQDKVSNLTKKRKTSTSPSRATIGNAEKRSTSRFETPRSGTPLEQSASPQIGTRKEPAKSGLRNEWVDENGMSSWPKEKWMEMGKIYRDRALGLKRLGDAYLRYTSAKPEYLARAPVEDHVRGLLCLTDSILMWLFAYWCEEQGSGRVRTSAYKESKPLRDHVKSAWEGRMRRGTTDERRDGARGMVGLMHLIEAVISYHTSSDSLSQLSKKSRQLDPSLVAPPTPTQSHSSHATSHDTAKPPGPSPSATAASPAPSGHSSGSHGSHNSHGSNPISDLFPLIAASTLTSVSASQHLLNSRHHLSLSLLRSRFPQSFDLAIHSELADQALPAPGDLLGSAKRLSIDEVDVFAWPIELGMHAPVAHVSVFGRCLVREYGEGIGVWQVGA